MRGCGRSDGPGIQSADSRGPRGNTHSGVAPGLAAKRRGTTQGFGLAETVEAPTGGFHCHVPAADRRRRAGRGRGRRTVLADEGERGGVRVVRPGNRNAAGIARKIGRGLRRTFEGASLHSRFPADAEASRQSENSRKRRRGCREGGGDGADDFRQREADAAGARRTTRCGRADGGNWAARPYTSFAGGKRIGLRTGGRGDSSWAGAFARFKGTLPGARVESSDASLRSDRRPNWTLDVAAAAQHGLCGGREKCRVSGIPRGKARGIREGDTRIWPVRIQCDPPPQAGDLPLPGELRASGGEDCRGEHRNGEAERQIIWKQHGLHRCAPGAREKAAP